MFKKTFWWFLPSQIIVFLISLIKYHTISLLHYINISFVIGGIILFLSMSVFLLNTGFFDITAEGFRRVLYKTKLSKEEFDEMRPLSEVITFNYVPMFINGLLMILVMIITLFFYYQG